MDGNVIKDLFFLIASNPIPSTLTIDLPVGKGQDCCSAFPLRALADVSTNDPLKNDVSGFLWWFNDVVSSASLGLYKWNQATMDWDYQTLLSDNTYGTFYDYGFFVNDANESFIGYQLQWKTVLTSFGAGSYIVRAIANLSTSGSATINSNEYCLKQYTSDFAEGTVYIEYYLNGILGVTYDDTARKDLGTLNWYNSLRLPGFFGYGTSSYESDYIQYNNGQRQFIEDIQEPVYVLKLRMIPAFVHDIMRGDVMQADQILITDYNSKNASTFIQKIVYKNSDYSPEWKKLQSKLANVEVKFKQESNNFRKFRN